MLETKRAYQITPVPEGHPAYIDFTTMFEIHVTDRDGNHWLFYIAPTENENIFEIIQMIDNFDDAVLDMLTEIWYRAISQDNKNK